MANAEQVTVFQCSICKYPLLTKDEVKVGVFFDDGRRLPSGNFMDRKLVCKDEFDCARRARENPEPVAFRFCSLDTFGMRQDGSTYIIRGDGCQCP